MTCSLLILCKVLLLFLSSAATISTRLRTTVLVGNSSSVAFAFSTVTAPSSIGATRRRFGMSASSLSSTNAVPPAGAASEARAKNLFRKTPLIFSDVLTNLCNGRPVYLKLDCLQASGSFKDRGMAHLCLQLVQEHGVTNIISSSGGNAGLAAACIARQLGNLQCTVVVPTTTKQLVIEKLQFLGATVQVSGENWNAADAVVRNMVASDASGKTAYIPPYEHELLWTGHSSVIDEIYSDPRLNSIEQQPSSTIILSVGGGGLLCGVLEGLERHHTGGKNSNSDNNNKQCCNVICAETVGASSFGQAWLKGESVTLSGIDSIATSLGALTVSATALERSKRHQEKQLGLVVSAICTDAEAVDACLKVRTHTRTLTQ